MFFRRKNLFIFIPNRFEVIFWEFLCMITSWFGKLAKCWFLPYKVKCKLSYNWSIIVTYFIFICLILLLLNQILFLIYTISQKVDACKKVGSRKIAPEENCPPPSPNSNANPKLNPDPDRGAIFLGGNFPDTKKYIQVTFQNISERLLWKFSKQYCLIKLQPTSLNPVCPVTMLN